MIITAMYIYGLAHRSWEFSWWNIMTCFAADCILIRLLSPRVSVRVNNEISDEEKNYFYRRAQVEELRRVELDLRLYGKR